MFLFAPKVASLCTGLEDAWQDLKMKAAERNRKLELSLKAQQFFFEASEVESWLAEKNDLLNSTDYGRDRDAASKLLTKHKVRFISHHNISVCCQKLFSSQLYFVKCGA